MNFKRVAILGVGLMGASLARALKKNALADHVVGNGRSEDNLKAALTKGYIDSYSLEPLDACKGADLIVIATPVESMPGIAAQIASAIEHETLVIDLGSIKGKLVQKLQELMPDGAGFVGCHPIAGSEKSGIDASSSTLYEGALCIITPSENQSKEFIDKAVSLWETIGSKVEIMSPDEHDRVYGLVSHLPHVAAYALINSVCDIDPEYLKFAGKGLRDTTRVASSSAELWKGITIENSQNMIEFIELLESNLKSIRLALKNNDSDGLLEQFKSAQDARSLVEDVSGH